MLIVTSASDFTRDSETSPGGVTKKMYNYNKCKCFSLGSACYENCKFEIRHVMEK